MTMPKPKYFDKPKRVPLLRGIVYGWKGTKQFHIAKISKPNLNQVPEFLTMAESQSMPTELNTRSLKEYMAKKLVIEE
jgi:hypothetical protein